MPRHGNRVQDTPQHPADAGAGGEGVRVDKIVPSTTRRCDLRSARPAALPGQVFLAWSASALLPAGARSLEKNVPPMGIAFPHRRLTIYRR